MFAPWCCNPREKTFPQAQTLAETHASFCLSEVKIGLVPAVISPYVVRAIGQRQASRYFITAETFDAATALANGLVHQTCDQSELDNTVNSVVKKLLNNGPQAVAEAKALVQYVADNSIDANSIDYTTELIANIRVSKEGQEGLGAFLEKRKPNWIQS